MNTDAIIECVPNFSEGSDEGKVREIVGAMQVEGCNCSTGRWIRRTTGRW